MIGLPTWVTDSGTTNSLTCYYDGTNCTVIAANNNSGHFAYPAGVCPTNAPSSGIFGCVQPVTLMPNYINPSTTFSGGSPTQGVGTPYLTIAPPGPDHKVVQYGDAVGNLVRVQLASGDLSDNANVSLLSASQTIAGDKTFTGKLDASNGTHTLPARTGLAGSKPAICTVGEIYFGSDATAGQNLFLCTSANTWTQQLNSGAGSGYGTIDNSGSALSQRATVNFTGPGINCVDNAGALRTDCTVSGSGATGSSLVNTTAVNASANVTSDQTLQELVLSAGYLNTVNAAFGIHGSGVFGIAAGQNPVLTYTVKLCTVSGCGSGTVVTLAAFNTGTATGTTGANNPWNINLNAAVVSTGSAGTLVVHGSENIDIGPLSISGTTTYNDGNTSATLPIDLSSRLYLDFTVASSLTAPGNTFVQQLAEVMPQAGASLSSAFGRSGAVVAQTGDYSCGQVTNAPCKNAANVYASGDNDFSAATLKLPAGSGFTAASGEIGIDLSQESVTFTRPDTGAKRFMTSQSSPVLGSGDTLSCNAMGANTPVNFATTYTIPAGYSEAARQGSDFRNRQRACIHRNAELHRQLLLDSTPIYSSNTQGYQQFVRHCSRPRRRFQTARDERWRVGNAVDVSRKRRFMGEHPRVA